MSRVCYDDDDDDDGGGGDDDDDDDDDDDADNGYMLKCSKGFMVF